MPEFTSPADIGNLALQFCGQPPMSPTLGFLDTNARARAVAAAYGKLRRAELRRALFKFAFKVAVIRPIDNTTAKIIPTLWSSSVTYQRGSIVADVNGTFWDSTINNNVGSANQPGVNFQVWVPYFGPLTCDVYNSCFSYFSGELVYTTAGDGTYDVFRSLVSSNTLDPAYANQWNANSMYDKSQVVVGFVSWAVDTTYAAGQAVVYTDGNYYVSLIDSNVGNIPSSGGNWSMIPTLSLIVSIYPSTSGNVPFRGTSPVIEWDIGQTYSLGDFITFNNRLYVSLVNENTGQFPYLTGSIYWAKVTGATPYMSLINYNINNPPSATPPTWAAGTTYSSNTLVAASDGLNYLSLQPGNTNNNPANGVNPTWWSMQTLTAWTSTFVEGAGNQQWVQIGGCNSPSDVLLVPENPIYPIGAGPSSQSESRNIFRLPSGFIREAPQDPKAGSVSPLGAPSGLFPNDWTYRGGNHIVSRQTDPIILQFQADVQDVTEFDDMFCVGLAERIALSVAEQLTQSTSVVATNIAAYKEFMGEARIVSGVETGPDEPAQDDYLVCRL